MQRCFPVLVAVTVILAAGTAEACPFCPQVAPTLGEQVARADVVALAQWVAATEARDEAAGSTTFELLELMKTPAGGLAKGSRVTLPNYRPGRAGDLFLLSGRMAGGVEWDVPLEVTETVFQYVAQAPSTEAPADKRLAYYLRFLEFSNPQIADDAFAEFAQARYEDVARLAPVLPRERIRRWVADPESPQHRLGLYGLMLGLCGDADDAKLMERRILDNPDEFRLGIDGVMAGYLLLTGEKGLDLIDAVKFKDRRCPDSETYAALQALRFMWTSGEGRIGRERCRESLRLLLDRPKMVEFVIRDLARWQDWNVQDRLAGLFDAADYDDPGLERAVRRAIVGYLIASTRDAPAGEPPPQHAVKGKALLETLRQKDPRTFEEASRFIPLD